MSAAWEMHQGVSVVECPSCGFCMDASHENDTPDGGYSCPNCEVTRLHGEVVRLQAVERAAKEVIDFYPTVAGTSILIRNANQHVPRNPWDNVADAIYSLSRAVAS